MNLVCFSLSITTYLVRKIITSFLPSTIAIPSFPFSALQPESSFKNVIYLCCSKYFQNYSQMKIQRLILAQKVLLILAFA